MDDNTRNFVLWLADLKSPFDPVYQAIDKTKPRVSFRKGNSDKEWTVDQVYEFYLREICKSEG